MKRVYLIGFLLFAGCSVKDYYVPKNKMENHLPVKVNYNKKLIDYKGDNLTFQSLVLKGKKAIYVNSDLQNHNLGKFTKFDKDVAVYNDTIWILSTNKKYKLPFTIFSLKKDKNLIAFVLEDNRYGILDLNNSKITIFNEKPALSVRYNFAKPFFYEGLILYPLLNGKLAVVDSKEKQFIRNILISSDEINSNIIFMKIVDNQLFIATSKKIILFNSNFLIDYVADIKHIINMGKFLYVFTSYGDIIKLDSNLKEIKRVKLPFASFYEPSICNKNIYVVEKGGYLLKITPSLEVSVYSGNDFKLGEWDRLKILNCKIYNSNKVFTIE